MEQKMNTAHIVIQVMESPDGTDMQVNLSYSGGTDLQRPDAQAAFAELLSSVEKQLEQSQID